MDQFHTWSSCVNIDGMHGRSEIKIPSTTRTNATIIFENTRNSTRKLPVVSILHKFERSAVFLRLLCLQYRGVTVPRTLARLGGTVLHVLRTVASVNN